MLCSKESSRCQRIVTISTRQLMSMVVLDRVCLLDSLRIFHPCPSGEDSKFGDFWGCFFGYAKQLEFLGSDEFLTGKLSSVTWYRIPEQRPLQQGTSVCTLRVQPACTPLSPFCTLSVCLFCSAGLRDCCVCTDRHACRLAGCRHSGQIPCPEFSFLSVFTLEQFPTAFRIFFWLNLAEC